MSTPQPVTQEAVAFWRPTVQRAVAKFHLRGDALEDAQGVAEVELVHVLTNKMDETQSLPRRRSYVRRSVAGAVKRAMRDGTMGGTVVRLPGHRHERGEHNQPVVPLGDWQPGAEDVEEGVVTRLAAKERLAKAIRRVQLSPCFWRALMISVLNLNPTHTEATEASLARRQLREAAREIEGEKE